MKGGIPGLAKSWEQTVEEVNKGYALTLDDYLNDLDGRQIFEEALGMAPEAEREKIRERVARVDRKMQASGRTRRQVPLGKRSGGGRGVDPGKKLVVFQPASKGRCGFSGRDR